MKRGEPGAKPEGPRERAACESTPAPAYRARSAAGGAAAPHPRAGRRRPRALRQRGCGIVLLAQPGRAEAPDAARHHRLLEPALAPGGPGAPHRRHRQRIRRSRSACRAAASRSWSTCSPAPCPSMPGLIVLMLQQRSMAQMIERQLTHRAAARSVSGLAAVLAHEIKNPLSGIRGAAQLLEPGLKDEDRALTQLICTETDRIRNLVDRMEVFGDERPLAREPVNIHQVLDHVKRLARDRLRRGHQVSARVRSLAAPGGGQPRQAHPGVPEPRQERRRSHRRGPRHGPHRSAHRLPARHAHWACPAAARASACR